MYDFTIKRKALLVKAISFLWGFLEATIFFIVPDVYLTGVVLKADLKKIWGALFYCLAGALLGGFLIYYSALIYPSLTLDLFNYVPGISDKLIQEARVDISADGLISMFRGMFQGVPYKLFAAAWGEKGGELLPFLLVSLVARGLRFVVSIIVTVFLKFLGEKLLKDWNTCKWILYSIFWLTFYTFYFNYYKW